MTGRDPLSCRQRERGHRLKALRCTRDQDAPEPSCESRRSPCDIRVKSGGCIKIRKLGGTAK